MIRFRKLMPLVAVLIGAVILGMPIQADAAFRIRVSVNGGATYLSVTDDSVTDNDGWDGSDPTTHTAGFISHTFAFPNVTLLVTVGQSKPFVGTPSIALLDIGINGSFIRASNGGIGGSVIVDITDTSFVSPGNPTGAGTLTASLGGGTGAGVLPANTTFTGYANGGTPGGNVEYGGIDPATGNVYFTPTATVGSPTQSVLIANLIAPYSMSARTTFSGAAGLTFSIDNNVTFNAAPAPAGLVLALAGMPVLSIGAWLRRRRVSTLA